MGSPWETVIASVLGSGIIAFGMVQSAKIIAGTAEVFTASIKEAAETSTSSFKEATKPLNILDTVQIRIGHRDGRKPPSLRGEAEIGKADDDRQEINMGNLFEVEEEKDDNQKNVVAVVPRRSIVSSGRSGTPPTA